MASPKKNNIFAQFSSLPPCPTLSKMQPIFNCRLAVSDYLSHLFYKVTRLLKHALIYHWHITIYVKAKTNVL